MPSLTVDLDLLATHLRDKMESEDLSVRAAAKAIGIGASTLTRLLQGKSNENVPDLSVITRAAEWVGKSLADLTPSKKSAPSTIAEVEVHLRALPNLAAPDVDFLVKMVRAGYERAKKLNPQKSSKGSRSPSSQS